jgi:hypothetical protein
VIVSVETTPLELPDPTLPGAAEVAWPLDHPRAINDILALLDSTWLSPETFARPTHYDIAVSVGCNIKCPFCPRQTFGDEIRSGLMQEKHFVTSFLTLRSASAPVFTASASPS